MRQHSNKSTRLNFDFPPEAHHLLKMQAVRLGVSIRELATKAILEKLSSLEEQEMLEDIQAADRSWEQFTENGSKTISHDEMMKRLGFNDL